VTAEPGKLNRAGHVAMTMEWMSLYSSLFVMAQMKAVSRLNLLPMREGFLPRSQGDDQQKHDRWGCFPDNRKSATIAGVRCLRITSRCACHRGPGGMHGPDQDR
jgi:hypothetical protein